MIYWNNLFGLIERFEFLCESIRNILIVSDRSNIIHANYYQSLI